MALKSNFEATNVISSPFVDEIVNPGDTLNAITENLRKADEALHHDRKPTPSAQISEADRDAAIAGTADERAQNEVNLAEARHGDKAGNKNRDKAEGR